MARLPRTFIQSEVRIHATCNSLICCKAGLNVVVKTRKFPFQLVLRSIVKQLARFCFPFYLNFKTQVREQEMCCKKQDSFYLKQTICCRNLGTCENMVNNAFPFSFLHKQITLQLFILFSHFRFFFVILCHFSVVLVTRPRTGIALSCLP